MKTLLKIILYIALYLVTALYDARMSASPVSSDEVSRTHQRAGQI